MVAALGLGGCGRNGPLELPPGAAAAAHAMPAAPPPSPTAVGPEGPTTTAQETAAKSGFDSMGNPIAGPGQKKGFFLDPLLQ